MPLILDNILVFLYRAIALFVLGERSRNWTVTEGVVEQSRAPEREMYPYAEIEYTYVVEGEAQFGRYTCGFWLVDSAKYFASLCPSGRKLVVRYDSKRPSKSFLCEGDQLLEGGLKTGETKNGLGPTRTPFGDW